MRALAGLTAQIVEPQGGMSSRSISNPSQFVRMLIRKGFITDLAKAVYNLDLGSPMVITTINTLLKPMESLTKIVTQFVAAQKRASAMAGNKDGETSQPVPDDQQTSSSGARPQRREEEAGSSGQTASGEGSSSQLTQAVEGTSAADRESQSTTQNDTSTVSESIAADESLIPLEVEVEEEREPMADPPPELLQEAINLGFDIGRRIRRGIDRAAEHDDDMDIEVSRSSVCVCVCSLLLILYCSPTAVHVLQDIVDELLERDSTGRTQGPAPILDVLSRQEGSHSHGE